MLPSRGVNLQTDPLAITHPTTGASESYSKPSAQANRKECVCKVLTRYRKLAALAAHDRPGSRNIGKVEVVPFLKRG